MTVAVERIDRLYLTVYVPKLQRVGGVVGVVRARHGATFASAALREPLTPAFVKALLTVAPAPGVPLLTCAPGQRTDEVAQDPERRPSVAHVEEAIDRWIDRAKRVA